MRKFRIGLAAISIVGVAAVVVTALVGAWVNGQTATSVLGQTDFTTATSGSGNNKFHRPLGVVVDPATGKVFVADNSNHRVLRFSSAQAATIGGSAEAVIGQPDFTTITFGVSQTKMALPVGLAIDTAGSLWVAEQGSNRVTRWDNAATVASGTAVAAQVLGQSLFTTNSQGLNQSKMNAPTTLFVDGAGRLFVTDLGNNRVLRFDNAATKANGGNADGVLGQPDFVTGSIVPPTQSTINAPIGVTGDQNGTVWVAESGNVRVLRFDNAATKANGANADEVLGQPDFVTKVLTTTQTGMGNPFGVAVDSIGRLYVTDSNRILVFNAAATLGNGAPANSVLGQSDFVSSTPGTTQSKLSNPWQVATVPGAAGIYVPDDQNNRVVHFIPANTTAANVTVSGRVLTSAGSGVRGARVVISDSRGNSFTAVTNAFGYYIFASVPSGDSYIGNATARGLTFSPRVIEVNDAIANLDLVAR
jgi:sugar lactone lactonase YvrE